MASVFLEAVLTVLKTSLRSFHDYVWQILGVRQKLETTEGQLTNDDHFWFAVPGESGDISEVTNA